MTKPVNKHPWRIGNEHGEMRFGHIIKENQFGILELVMIQVDIISGLRLQEMLGKGKRVALICVLLVVLLLIVVRI